MRVAPARTLLAGPHRNHEVARHGRSELGAVPTGGSRRDTEAQIEHQPVGLRHLLTPQNVTAALGGEVRIRVDDGGGVHEDGVRIGAIRRTSTGEWITERQNRAAPGAATDVPAKD